MYHLFQTFVFCHFCLCGPSTSMSFYSRGLICIDFHAKCKNKTFIFVKPEILVINLAHCLIKAK